MRPGPIRSSISSTAASSASGSVMSTPDAHQWHESRQIPRRGWWSSLSMITASSSTERPIVPPAPAEFSSRSQRSSVVSARSSRRGGTILRSALREPGAQVGADVEDDALGADRGRRLQRGAQRRDGLLSDLAIGAGEVDEVERMADDRARRATPRRRARNRSSSSGERTVGFHICGLCVNTWTASQPSSSARSIAVAIPPEIDTCAP